MTADDLSRIVVDTGLHVHRELGPGLLESVYEMVLAGRLSREAFAAWSTITNETENLCASAPSREPQQNGNIMMTLAYKILTTPQWAQFQSEGVFTGAPVDLADGYIHMSTADQLDETLGKHFAGQTGLIIATIDLAKLNDALKWEVSRGGALFPHHYGALPMGAVVETKPA